MILCRTLGSSLTALAGIDWGVTPLPTGASSPPVVQALPLGGGILVLAVLDLILLFVLVVAAVTCLGRGDRGAGQAVADVECRKIRRLSPGRVRVEGIVRTNADGDTVPPAITDRRAVVRRVAVEQHDRHGIADEGPFSRWRTLHEDVTAVPFRVDDGTGTVVVHPGDATLAIETTGRWRRVVDGRGDPPEGIRRYVAREPAVSDGTLDTSVDGHTMAATVRFTEDAIEPGMEVTVVGEAVERGDGRGRGVLEIDGSQGDLVLSDRSATALAESSQSIARGIYAVGMAVALLGIGLLTVLVLGLIAFR